MPVALIVFHHGIKRLADLVNEPLDPLALFRLLLAAFAAVDRDEAELLDIPAFLRRQAD